MDAVSGMRIEHLSDHDGLPTVTCIVRFAETSVISTMVERHCSISWFIDSIHEFEHEGLRQSLEAIVALHPNLIHVFGRTAGGYELQN